MDFQNEITRLKRVVYFLQRRAAGTGGGAVDSVNGQTGVVSLAVDDLSDVVAPTPSDNEVLTWDSGTSKWVNQAVSGTGDVTGPASSTDSEIVIYSGTTGKIIKNSSKVLTTVGGNIAALTNPSAITFIRINADNTVTARSAANFLTDIGAQVAGSYLTAANIVATITNGVTTNAPSEDAVFDALALKVSTTGDETIAGIKTFSSFPVTPSSAPTTDYQAANKKYVDDNSGTSSDEAEFSLMASFRSLYNY
jgi:hypothetical protein